MRAQVTVTVNEAKRIIAKGISRMPSVQNALRSGKIFLKGGTTVSCVSEELTGKPLRISGRIVPEGTKTAQVQSLGFHCALIEGGELIDADESLEQTIENLKAQDVAVIGANAIDVFGNSALMYGIALGGGPGRIISGVIAEIENIIIAAGLEKLVPGSITDIVTKAGRKNVDRSIGMAVGLIPLGGRIITEKDAISLLAEVSCTVVGRGGVFGAEGATTMIIEGDKREVENVFQIILSLKDQKVSGTQKSLPSCTAPHERCKIHRACIYKKTKKRD
ncbi:MAG: hypothetical protein KAJ09_03095 [Deltaproteobacteria bacterium]|nr:hypothetical protein [Deltaproteobacteria bacterium]